MSEIVRPEETRIPRLGPAEVPSPMQAVAPPSAFVDDAPGILLDTDWEKVRARIEAGEEPPCLEPAGPRRRLFFRPREVRAAIVTCGGLCPGINDVVRAVVLTLHWHYGVREIFGIRYGLRGFATGDAPPLRLTPEVVRTIHHQGGSFLGSSRGTPPPERIAEVIERRSIDQLYMVGGDGTQRAALAISEAARRRGLNLAVIGIPKTIDNDIPLVDRTFGFTTAISVARHAVDAAHAEAEGAYNGVGVVRLMGREAGFIAAHAALASGEANFVLVPEVPFGLDGPDGFLAHLERRVAERRHAVVVVAEGAGQDLLAEERRRLGCDASGNPRLADIGGYLCRRIREHFRAAGLPLTLKYIDPGYTIRSAPAVAFDAIYAQQLGQNAVHAAMAGKTEMLVGRVHGRQVHVPIRLVTRLRKRIDPGGLLWRAVLQSTGQPARMGGAACSPQPASP
ncbi:MAG: ATP-dependent 6-phosphofructokinase [Acidobacteria bacterium]|nr:MAG: ATP-dependent 6-phosphofructokinase [Acidobacteriota bacterium]